MNKTSVYAHIHLREEVEIEGCMVERGDGRGFFLWLDIGNYTSIFFRSLDDMQKFGENVLSEVAKLKRERGIDE